MLIFFNTIALGAVDYEMVDSDSETKWSTCGTYKAYSDKDRFSTGKKFKHLRYHVYKEMEKKIYPHINEKTVRGFKKRYEAQIKDEIGKKKSSKAVVEFRQQIPRTFMFTWK